MAAQRYYRKPQAVDAIQFTGTNFDELDAWIAGAHFDYIPEADEDDCARVLVTENYTWRPLYTGNWVICWDEGEYAILTDDQFRADYELAGGA